jgi:HTH-type transcriptional regulator/antitoxin HigA
MISLKNYTDAQLWLEELLVIEDVECTQYADELIEASDIIAQYEEIHYAVDLPSLKDVIELRMFELKLKQKDLAKLLNVSASRINEIFNGKREITLNIAKALHNKLDIDSDIILQ